MHAFNADNGNAYRRNLIEQAEESCQAARKLINIYAALSVAALSLHRQEDLPSDIEAALSEDPAAPQAALIAEDTITCLEEPSEEGYDIQDLFLPTPQRLRLFCLPSALMVKEGLGLAGFIPAAYSPTKEDMNVFDKDFSRYPSPFIEYQIDLADKMVEGLAPMVDALWAYTESELDLGYEGADLWPFAMAVMAAKSRGEDLSESAQGWIHEYWDVAIETFEEYENNLTSLACEDNLDEDSEPVPARILH